MPNVMKALRAEIRQMARHESQRASKPIRDQIRGLRRTLTAIERRLATVKGTGSGGPSGAGGTVDGRRARFAPAVVRQHRSQLGLSRKAYAKLLGVSSLSVYFWETGRTRPRRETILALQDLKKKGVRELRRQAGAAAAPAAKRSTAKSAKPVKSKKSAKPKEAVRRVRKRAAKAAAKVVKAVKAVRGKRRRTRRPRRGTRAKAA